MWFAFPFERLLHAEEEGKTEMDGHGSLSQKKYARTANRLLKSATEIISYRSQICCSASMQNLSF